jgi:hypothetical protein
MPSLEELAGHFDADEPGEESFTKFQPGPEVECLLDEARRIEEAPIILPDGRRRLKEINRVLRRALREV